jgi:uroporphyrinogen-III synthase
MVNKRLGRHNDSSIVQEAMEYNMVIELHDMVLFILKESLELITEKEPGGDIVMEGKRIVTAGARKHEEFSSLVEKQGGIPVIRSMQGTVYLAEDAVEKDLRRLLTTGTDWLIFVTGIGMETLLDQAEKLGVLEPFLNLIKQSKVAARGYKTLAVLKKIDIKPNVVDDDGTNRGLIKAMDELELEGQRVVVQLHGEPAPGLIRFLEERGAFVTKLLPYKHIAPEPQIVDTLCREVTEGTVDAVCFTTGLQIHNLFAYAKEHGYGAEIKKAFENKVLAVSIGKLTSESLIEEGVERILVPDIERLGAMIFAIRDYYRL